MSETWTDKATGVGTLLTVLVTLLVGFAAWWVSRQSSKIAAASIVPLLQMRDDILKKELDFTLVNWGLGPAILKSIYVAYPPVPYLVTECMRFYAPQDQQEAVKPPAVDIEAPKEDREIQLQPGQHDQQRDVNAQDRAESKLKERGMLAEGYKERYGKVWIFSNRVQNDQEPPAAASLLAYLRKLQQHRNNSLCQRIRRVFSSKVHPKMPKLEALDHKASLVSGPLFFSDLGNHMDAYTQTPLGPMVRNAVGFSNSKEGDFRLVHAKSQQDTDEWKLCKLVILGHLSGIRLIIDYTDAMGKIPLNTPLDYTFEYVFNDKEKCLLKRKLLRAPPTLPPADVPQGAGKQIGSCSS